MENKIKFTAQEVKDIVYERVCPEGFEWVDKYSSNYDRRGSRIEFVVLKKDDKFYELWWEKGLTESQENYFEDQELQEVVKKEITTYEWVGVKK